jgi:hypothetical protein
LEGRIVTALLWLWVIAAAGLSASCWAFAAWKLYPRDELSKMRRAQRRRKREFQRSVRAAVKAKARNERGAK